MTYALSWPLQQAIYGLMSQDAACAAWFADRVYDAPPHFQAEAAPDGLYLTFGDEDVTDWSTADDAGAEHLVRITVHAPRQGFAEAKQAASAVSDAILGGDLAPSRGHVVNARFVDARTRRRDDDGLRQIEMRFRLRLEDTA
ncbi:MAG: DUF3168 domain-containing protein [Pseudomonadota bacterium]